MYTGFYRVPSHFPVDTVVNCDKHQRKHTIAQLYNETSFNLQFDDDDDDVYYYISERLKLEGETENMSVCTKE